MSIKSDTPSSSDERGASDHITAFILSVLILGAVERCSSLSQFIAGQPAHGLAMLRLMVFAATLLLPRALMALYTLRVARRLGFLMACLFAILVLFMGGWAAVAVGLYVLMRGSDQSYLPPTA